MYLSKSEIIFCVLLNASYSWIALLSASNLQIEPLPSKTESDFEKDEKAIKKGISNSFNFLKKIDKNLEGGGE